MDARRSAVARFAVARFAVATLLSFVGCGSAAQPFAPTPGATPPDAAMPPPDAATPPPATLEVQFLGVAGYLLRAGDDAVLTAPLFTRPSLTDVTVGAIASDAALVQASAPPLDGVRAIVSGHAHYDHFLDTPELLHEAPDATLYSNVTGAHILAALAPDPAPACAPSPPPPVPLPRARVVAMDDPSHSVVDYRPCEAQRPAGAPDHGTWVRVPGARVRLYAICSSHPDQVGPYHFGAGSVDADLCTLPTVADDWREGQTLALLIDFLDACDRPVYRIYYQDAPTSVPSGIPPADVLADKRVDLALLNVGNYDKVVDAPAATLAALQPRFALGGHWEDFFQPASAMPPPLPLTDLAAWTQAAAAALPSTADGVWRRNGAATVERAVLPSPSDRFTIALDAGAGAASCP